jgi:hypothetical protein
MASFVAHLCASELMEVAAVSRNNAAKTLAGILAQMILIANDPEQRPDFAKKALSDAFREALRPTALPSQATSGIGHNRGPPLEGEPALYTIAKFCQTHTISRSGLYALWRRGIGPKVIRLGRSVKITREAAVQWRAERQEATNAARRIEHEAASDGAAV